jgi:hypothetical protein
MQNSTAGNASGGILPSNLNDRIQFLDFSIEGIHRVEFYEHGLAQSATSKIR